MLLRGGGECVQRGVQPQRGGCEAASGPPGLAQLLGEHERHLVAVLMPEGGWIAVEQSLVNGPARASHTRHQPGCARLFHEGIQARHLGRGHALSETGEAVVAAPLVGA